MTAFIFHCGLFQFRVLPFGLCILPNEGKVRAATDFKTPTCVKQVRQFLGLTDYYIRFIHDYAHHAEPLFVFTRTDVPFVWSSECQTGMDFLKDKLTSAPVLRFLDFSLPFFIHTDACDIGLDAALMQRDNNGRDVVVAYVSRALLKSERPYSTPEKESLAVIWALEHFQPALLTVPPPLPRVFLCTGPVHPGRDLPRCPSLRHPQSGRASRRG
uniref:Reverse transcriptase/retrotransposon-derived protein RNase H-like domain-containing protein n=1 Tax=Cyprinus carpio TaxID=7962 RepID=A0A8C1S0B5_CYPCA